MKIRLAKKIVKLADEEEGSKEHPLGYWGTRFLIGIDHRITKAIRLTSKKKKV